ncbi:MFS general substrate transporter [Dendrothele bispora CBS 962.96]|uniref:MFS general substrate transporter n=1 Tax=Dendrothele bispora (strain CBS 962.96) TaxID=1314807 RepID=A0A4S8L2L9_DENBC|nr:MFS general substrate transporter [Dendrothele bispora CBS 962.96]
MQPTENIVDIADTKSKDVEKSPATESVSSNLDLAAREEGVSAIYEAKSRLINEYLQTEIGFGRYQIQLFVLTGLGWAADNIWLQGVAIILPQIQRKLNPSRVEFTTLSLYVGLLVGATTWGILADLIGRKLSFNITLFIAGVFGIAAGGANNFTTLGALVACIGFGIGGNDAYHETFSLGAIFLEHVPRSHQWLLTLLSAWWALGQLFASIVAWPLIGNFSCQDASFCPKDSNMGWRYTFYTLGGVTFVMWIMRYVVFDLQESSKYLIAKGRDEEALAVLQRIAAKNGKTLTLTLSQLQSVSGSVPSSQPSKLSTAQVLIKAVSSFSFSHVTPLFSTRRLAINTTITLLLWGLIGLAYPLFNGFITLYLTTQVKDTDGSVGATYRSYTIISVMGIPGSVIACLVVDWTRKNPGKFSLGGRKLTMAVSTALTGVFLYLFTTSTSSAAVLGYSCASGLTQNAMYGVLFAYTPEVFPAPHRGTGDALCSAFNRFTGTLAPVIKIVTTNADGSASNGTANGPIFVSATLFMVTSALMLLLPIETAGKAAL